VRFLADEVADLPHRRSLERFVAGSKIARSFVTNVRSTLKQELGRCQSPARRH
jgi:hypothetical protein